VGTLTVKNNGEVPWFGKWFGHKSQPEVSARVDLDIAPAADSSDPSDNTAGATTALQRINAFLEEKGEGIHHIALEVDDIEKAMGRAESQRSRPDRPKAEKGRSRFQDRLSPSQRNARGASRTV
jgi:catechol 2,3-dioxygenase-like lactoylglutathione lyase family enzyme